MKYILPKYTLTSYALQVLKKGRILAPQEKPQSLLKRVVIHLFSCEDQFGTSLRDKKKLILKFSNYIVEGAMLPGSPTLTNAGRYQNTALSSCTVIPVNLKQKETAYKIIKAYYRQNMGSGFDFTPYKNPVKLLLWLNRLSVYETATGQYDRYIGNIGTLHVSHPKIRDFIRAKLNSDHIKHFNISVDITSDFMEAAINLRSYKLADGTYLDANKLLEEIAQNAWSSGDPGLISMERMNKDNPVAKISPYTSVPPCGEMGLAHGETCQFGYINIFYFVNEKGINYEKLADATKLLTRVLDNAIENSINNYPTTISSRLAKLKRKIGIGVCGLADVLLYFGLPYDSERARNLARDILSFINYCSKVASIELAKTRGPCLAMYKTKYNDYLSGRYIEDKFASQKTSTVSRSDWLKLAKKIKQTLLLRNILTTALPPTGRTSILLNKTPSIEPFFSVMTDSGEKINPSMIQFISRYVGRENIDKILNQARKEKTFQKITALPYKVRLCLKTAKEISPLGHLKMVSALVAVDKGVYDETASKTLNLPHNATVNDIKNIFIAAYKLGLKNISVYRDGTKLGQPKTL